MFTFLREFEFWDDRNKLRFFSITAGLLFAFGWWLFIDASLVVSAQNDSMIVPPQLFLPGVASSLSLIVIVSTDVAVIKEDEYGYHGDPRELYQIKALFWFSCLMLLFCFFVSIYVLIHVYSHGYGIRGKKPDSVYPGVALFLHSLSTIMATCLLRFARTDED
mmetsp:Transcript_3833/g.4650  ORF Transcript_3833/g.4650 Transcript_3833/m.4650 type:complete len:163 (-) Transcript_3833:285-773(-)